MGVLHVVYDANRHHKIWVSYTNTLVFNYILSTCMHLHIALTSLVPTPTATTGFFDVVSCAHPRKKEVFSHSTKSESKTMQKHYLFSSDEHKSITIAMLAHTSYMDVSDLKN